MAEFQLKAIITGVDKLSPALTKMQKSLRKFKGDLVTGLKGAAVVGSAVAAAMAVPVKLAIDFESAMADVKKVVDFDTPEQFSQMSEDVLNLSKKLPMAANGIAAIVAAGGQSGVARDELMSFAESAVKMGVAFDLSADEAGQMMAQWRTALNLTQSGVVELSDKINYLGNTGPANAQKISDIVTRLGPLGGVAGVASGEVAAMGATIAGMGVESEVAATGIKNFMLALTKGDAATKKQQTAFQLLNIEPGQLAKDMQSDSRAAILKVLESISKLSKDKQTSILTQLFGSESVSAIAPMLSNLSLLKENFNKVADAEIYAGSMEKEYAARADTTANNMQLFANKVEAVGVNIGSVLLPAINDVLDKIGPLIDGFADFAKRNPALVKSIAAVSLALMGVGTAIGAVSLAMSLSPIGLLIMGIAAGATLIIANWDKIGAWFSRLWENIKRYFQIGWEVIKRIFLNTNPLGLIIKNWDTIGPYFEAFWESIKAAFIEGFQVIKDLFLDYTPLGLIIQNWEPIVGWFKDMWERIKPYIEPILKGVEATQGLKNLAMDKASGALSDIYDFFIGDAVRTVDARSVVGRENNATYKPSDYLTASKQEVSGEMVVRFENSPAGMNVVDTSTNQNGFNMGYDVGYTRFAK